MTADPAAAAAAVVDDAEEQFRRALEQDAGAAAAAAAPPSPPRRDPDAPHGRDESGAPLAPYGSKADGTPRIKPAGPGRGGRAAQAAGDKPRVTAAAAPHAAGAPRDFTGELDELGQGLWMIMSGLPIPVPALKVRIQAQAGLLELHRPQLVRSVNVMAQHSPGVAAAVDRMSTGTAGWILPAMFGLAPFVGQSLAMWRAPVAGDVEALAAGNEAAFQDRLEGAARALEAQLAQLEHERIVGTASARAA